MKWHRISSNKHLLDLFGRLVREWNDVNNLMDIERAVHKKCYRGSEAHFEHDETLYVCLWGLTEVIPDTE